MFAKTPERQMHMVRWLLTCGRLLLIFSMFYDPISPWLTDPNNTLSPLRIHPEVCVKVQGVCLEQTPYALGARLFWTMIVPAAIFILLVFGHELWRRICPLSFLSQIPRALGRQRQHRRQLHLYPVHGVPQLFVPTVWFILSWSVHSITLCQL